MRKLVLLALVAGCGMGVGSTQQPMLADGAGFGDLGACGPAVLAGTDGWCKKGFDCKMTRFSGLICGACRCRDQGSTAFYSGCFQTSPLNPQGEPCGDWTWTVSPHSSCVDHNPPCVDRGDAGRPDILSKPYPY